MTGAPVDPFTLSILVDSLALVGWGIGIAAAVYLRVKRRPFRYSVVFLFSGIAILMASATWLNHAFTMEPWMMLASRAVAFALMITIEVWGVVQTMRYHPARKEAVQSGASSEPVRGDS